MTDNGPESLLHELVAAVDTGERVVLATVVDTCRSVPRHAGSKMLVHEDGRRSGTIGGGAVEARVATAALAALADGQARLVRYDLLDPLNGEPGTCGGEMTVYLEPHLPTPTVLVIGCGTIGRAVVDLARCRCAAAWPGAGRPGRGACYSRHAPGAVHSGSTG